MGGDTQGEQVTKVCAVESHSPIVPVGPRNAGSILIYIYMKIKRKLQLTHRDLKNKNRTM